VIRNSCTFRPTSAATGQNPVTSSELRRFRLTSSEYASKRYSFSKCCLSNWCSLQLSRFFTPQIQPPIAPLVHPKMNSGKEFPSVSPCGCVPSARFPCGIRITNCGMGSAMSRLPCPASHRTKRSHLRLKFEPGLAISFEEPQPNEIAQRPISNRAGTEGHALSAQSGASRRRQQGDIFPAFWFHPGGMTAAGRGIASSCPRK
jgi:hypothetical protein